MTSPPWLIIGEGFKLAIMDRKKIAETIRRERKILGLSLKRFAELVGTSKATLQRIETGQKSPSIELLYEISQICRKPFDDFICDDRNGFYLLNEQKQRKIKSQDFEISIIAPYGLISRDILVNYFKGKQGSHIYPKQERGYHWAYILQGVCLFHYDGMDYEVRKGDVIYYDAGKTFSFQILEPLEGIRIAIRI